MWCDSSDTCCCCLLLFYFWFRQIVILQFSIAPRRVHAIRTYTSYNVSIKYGRAALDKSVGWLAGSARVSVWFANFSFFFVRLLLATFLCRSIEGKLKFTNVYEADARVNVRKRRWRWWCKSLCSLLYSILKRDQTAIFQLIHWLDWQRIIWLLLLLFDSGGMVGRPDERRTQHLSRHCELLFFSLRSHIHTSCCGWLCVLCASTGVCWFLIPTLNATPYGALNSNYLVCFAIYFLFFFFNTSPAVTTASGQREEREYLFTFNLQPV